MTSKKIFYYFSQVVRAALVFFGLGLVLLFSDALITQLHPHGVIGGQASGNPTLATVAFLIIIITLVLVWLNTFGHKFFHKLPHKLMLLADILIGYPLFLSYFLLA